VPAERNLAIFHVYLEPEFLMYPGVRVESIHRAVWGLLFLEFVPGPCWLNLKGAVRSASNPSNDPLPVLPLFAFRLGQLLPFAFRLVQQPDFQAALARSNVIGAPIATIALRALLSFETIWTTRSRTLDPPTHREIAVEVDRNADGLHGAVGEYRDCRATS
jgi:hypothetical protein